MGRPSSKDRFRGCILGAAIGDALGAPYEFTRQSSHDIPNDGYGVGVFNTQPGDATDDSTLTKFHAKAWIDGKEFDAVQKLYVEQLIEWYNKDPLDMGRQTRAAIAAHIAGLKVPDTGSCGNGSLMAVSPAGLMAKNPMQAGEWGHKFSRNTHPNELCKYVCGIFTTAIYELSRTDRAPARLISAPVPSWFPIDGPNMGYVATACGLAFEALDRYDPKYNNCGFEVLKWIINCGGDTDTNASIAGALIGAAHGMHAWEEPAWLVNHLVDHQGWLDLADELYEASL